MGFRNPFKTPLAFTPSVSVPTHHQDEHYQFPNEYDVSAQHADPLSDWEVRSGYPAVSDNYQSGDWNQNDPSMPGYARHYSINRMEAVQPVIDLNADQMPAPGANSMSMPRDFGGRGAVNRLPMIVGPVTGQESNWTGQTMRVARKPLEGKGPVTGSDYGSQLTAAYYQQANAYFDYAAAQASLVAAI